VQSFVQNSERKGPLEKPRSSWEKNIKLDPKGTGWVDMDRIHLAQESDKWRVLVNTVTNLRVQKDSRNFLVNKQILTSPEELSSMEVV
jgi:hypothetical protein